MQAHHYLGALPKIGETIWYVATYHGHWVALLSFSAAAWKCGAWDRWIGWDFRHHYDRLKLLANNPLIALAVVLHILWTGWRLANDAVSGLMDHSWPEAEQQVLEQVLDGFRAPEITFHAVRTRISGAQRFVSFHVLVPGAWTVQRGHDLLEQIQKTLVARLPNVSAFTGVLMTKVRHQRQGLDARVGEHPLDGLVFGIDGHDGPVEPALEEVPGEHRSDGSRSLACADECHGPGLQGEFQVANAHLEPTLVNRLPRH